MPMNRYDQDLTFKFSTKREARLLVVDGSIDISVWDGVNWIATDTFTSGSYEYYTDGAYLKVELGSGTYSFYTDLNEPLTVEEVEDDS